MFGFVDFIQRVIKSENLNTKLSNPIDERMWQEREYQHTLLLALDNFGEERLIKYFRYYMKEEVTNHHD